MDFYEWFFTWGLLVYGVLSLTLLVFGIICTAYSYSETSMESTFSLESVALEVGEAIGRMHLYIIILPLVVLLSRMAILRPYDHDFLKSGNHLLYLFLWAILIFFNALMGYRRNTDTTVGYSES